MTSILVDLNNFIKNRVTAKLSCVPSANAHTNTATTKRETSVAVGRISVMHAMKRSSYRL